MKLTRIYMVLLFIGKLGRVLVIVTGIVVKFVFLLCLPVYVLTITGFRIIVSYFVAISYIRDSDRIT